MTCLEWTLLALGCLLLAAVQFAGRDHREPPHSGKWRRYERS